MVFWRHKNDSCCTTFFCVELVDVFFRVCCQAYSVPLIIRILCPQEENNLFSSLNIILCTFNPSSVPCYCLSIIMWHGLNNIKVRGWMALLFFLFVFCELWISCEIFRHFSFRFYTARIAKQL